MLVEQWRKKNLLSGITCEDFLLQEGEIVSELYHRISPITVHHELASRMLQRLRHRPLLAFVQNRH
jgi:hypothetical protein